MKPNNDTPRMKALHRTLWRTVSGIFQSFQREGLPPPTTPPPTDAPNPPPTVAQITSELATSLSLNRSGEAQSAPALTSPSPNPITSPRPVSRIAECGHLVRAPFPTMTFPPIECQLCHLRSEVRKARRAWSDSIEQHGHGEQRTRAARKAHDAARAALQNHLDALADVAAAMTQQQRRQQQQQQQQQRQQQGEERRGESGDEKPQRAAAKAVRFAEGVREGDGGRPARQFRRRKTEYVPGRWAGNLLNTAGMRMPSAIFYADEEQLGRGLSTFRMVVGDRLAGEKIAFYPCWEELPEEERRRAFS